MNDFLPYISPALTHILASLKYFYPELAITVLFIVVIFADLFFASKKSNLVFWLSLAGIVVETVLSFNQLLIIKGPVLFFSGMITNDRVSVLFKLIFSLVAVLFILFIRNNKTLAENKKGTGDLYVVLIAVLLGFHLMAMSASLLMIYIAIEMVSIGSYVMVGYISGDNKQTEAAMKYALFGSVCSAVMLYGMSLLYGLTGTLNILEPQFLANLQKVSLLSASLPVIMVLVGIGFKLSFVPFHFWSPDVYEGAPTPVTAFLSTGPKIAGFAILIRFLSGFLKYTGHGLTFVAFDFQTLLIVVAILTMIAGNFAAIWQDNAKRMLAYSSIGHTGFLLMAIPAFSASGFTAIIYYLFIYAMMNMASFMLVDRIEEKTGVININDYRGLGRLLKPELVCFVIILLSLTGFPPTGGFVGKFLVFSSALEYYTTTGANGMLALMAVGALTTVVSLFYYFKIPLNAYLRKAPEREITAPEGPLPFLIIILTFFIVLFGVFPSLVTDFIKSVLIS